MDFLSQEAKVATLIDAGVDWLTVSYADRVTGLAMVNKLRPLLRQQVKLGNTLRPWASCGYTGWAAGSIQTGERDDGLLIRLGSDVARFNWKGFYNESSNCSRIDVQVTVSESCPPGTTLAQEFRTLGRVWANKGNAPTVSYFHGTDGSATLYVCKRSSEMFGRIYDKGAESKIAHYRNALRWEVECKGDKARSIARAMVRADNDQAEAHAQCLQFFRNRGASCRSLLALGLVYKMIPNQRLTAESAARTAYASDRAKSLRWLTASVRPTIERLSKSGSRRDLLIALGLADGPMPWMQDIDQA